MPSGGRLGAEDSLELLEVIGALKLLKPEIEGVVRSASSEQLTAAWGEELTARPGFNNPQRKDITANPTVLPHRMGLEVSTGGTGRYGDYLTRSFEFGTTNQPLYNVYTRKSKNGGTHRVTRRTSAQMPTRSRSGWIAYPAAGQLGQRAFAMIMQVIVKVTRDAIDGGRNG